MFVYSEILFWNQMQSNVQPISWRHLLIINLSGEGVEGNLSWKNAHLGFIYGTSHELSMEAQSDYNHHTVVVCFSANSLLVLWVLWIRDDHNNHNHNNDDDDVMET